MNKQTKTKAVEQWKSDIQKRVYETKVANRKAKYDAIKTEVNQKLHDLINIYFSNFTLDEEENKNTYNILNEEWKALCRKLSATASKIISLDYHAFEKAIEKNMESAEFKDAIEKMKSDAENPEEKDNCPGGDGRVISASLVDENGHETQIPINE